jgi:hypothetical protein
MGGILGGAGSKQPGAGKLAAQIRDYPAHPFAENPFFPMVSIAFSNAPHRTLVQPLQPFVFSTAIRARSGLLHFMPGAGCLWHSLPGCRPWGARVSGGVASLNRRLPPEMPPASERASTSAQGRAHRRVSDRRAPANAVSQDGHPSEMDQSCCRQTSMFRAEDPRGLKMKYPPIFRLSMESHAPCAGLVVLLLFFDA